MIAIIPARGGSKGLPEKNIKKLNGIPLIGHTVMAAKNANCIERVIVSTDDENIADVAREYGAEVPFVRPEILATDTASAVDVYIHAVDFLMKRDGVPIKSFMVLLPTVPFRTAKHIEEAYELFLRSKAKTLISVRKTDVPPSWYLTNDNSGYLQNCGFGISRGITKNRQEELEYYIPNGAIYILNYDLLKEQRTYYCESTVGYKMTRLNSIDIDTADDFLMAEFFSEKLS